jgi:HSP20 family protein
MKTSWQHFNDELSDAWANVIDGWRKLYRRASRALTRFGPGGGRELSRAEAQQLAVRSAGWGVLACEVFDDDDRVIVRLEAPGMEKGDFELEVLDDRLLVRGEKQMERERTQGGYYITECAYGSFERAIPLPDEVDTDKASASYRQGVLRVELPKTAPRRRRSVAVEVD